MKLQGLSLSIGLQRDIIRLLQNELTQLDIQILGDNL